MSGFKLMVVVASVCLVANARAEETKLILRNGDENCFVEKFDGGLVKPGSTEKILIEEGAELYEVRRGKAECENFFDMGDKGLHRVSLYLEFNRVSEADTGKPFKLVGTGKMYHVVGCYSIGNTRPTFSLLRSTKPKNVKEVSLKTSVRHNEDSMLGLGIVRFNSTFTPVRHSLSPLPLRFQTANH